MTELTSTVRSTAPTETRSSKGLAIAGLVCGLVGLVLHPGPARDHLRRHRLAIANHGGSFHWHVG